MAMGFLRRRPAYRETWEQWQHQVHTEGDFPYAVTDNHEAMILKFGVAVAYDPSRPMDDWAAMCLFRPASGFIVRFDPKERDDDRFADYRFDIAKAIEPQFNKARGHLLALQADLHETKKNTPRPSRELWPLYLRVLDARDSGVSWEKIGKTLWPTDKGKLKDKARRTHESAVGVRDNFPI
jgi:hypothetical protein